MRWRDRITALILPSSTATLFLHSSLSLCPISKARRIYSDDCYWLNLSGTKAHADISTTLPLAIDARAVIHFTKLPEEKCRYSSLQFGRKSQMYRLLFHEFAITFFFALSSSVLSLAVTWWYLAPEAIFILRECLDSKIGSFLND